MTQNHHAGGGCGRIPTVLVTAHAGDEVERAATPASRTPSPAAFVVDDDLSVLSFLKFLWLRRGLEPPDMQRRAPKAREVAPPRTVERG